jgi:hypothetical protein
LNLFCGARYARSSAATQENRHGTFRPGCTSTHRTITSLGMGTKTSTWDFQFLHGVASVGTRFEAARDSAIKDVHFPTTDGRTLILPLHRTHRRPETSGPPPQTRSSATAATTYYRARKDRSPPSQRRVVQTFAMIEAAVTRHRQGQTTCETANLPDATFSRHRRRSPPASSFQLRSRPPGRYRRRSAHWRVRNGAMSERDFTAREDRFIGVCLAAAANYPSFHFHLVDPIEGCRDC